MKYLRIVAALALAILASLAQAQTNQGSSPLTIIKGGTGATTEAAARSSLKVDQFTGHGDSNYSILTTDRVVGTNAAFTASRTWTLPAADSVNAGQSVIVADFHGTVTGSNTLIIARAGSDTVNGGTSVTINTANGAYALWSDGSSKWTAQAIGSSATAGVSSLDGATGAISVQSGGLKVVSGTLGSNVLPSRAFAATQDLSAFTAIQTLGYAEPGDGGGATFQKLVSGSFIDSYITTFTIAGGSGYTNGGPYYGAIFTGPGTKPFAIGTVTVSGGAITAVNISGTPSNQCAVGDVYSLAGSAAVVGGAANGLPAGGSGASITVTGCSTALGSFTDAASNKFQLVVTNGSGPIVQQFGVKGDWNNVDASSTDNFNAIQAISWFATFKSSTSYDAGGFWGGRVHFPPGAYMVCGTGLKSLIIPHGVQFWGAGGTASSIHFCDSFNSGAILFEFGDPNWHFACFQSSLWHMAITSRGSGTAYAGHSNCGQDYSGIYDSYFFLNGNSRRPCFHYEAGFGGSSNWAMERTSCNAQSAAAMVRIGNTIASGLNVGSTAFNLTSLVLGGPSAGVNLQTGPGILLNGGHTTILWPRCEQMPNCVAVDIGATGNAELVSIKNAIAGSGAPGNPCNGVILLAGTNTAGNTTVEQSVAGSCGFVVQNGQSGGVNDAGPVRLQKIYNP